MDLQEALDTPIFPDIALPIEERRHQSEAVSVLKRAARKYQECLKEVSDEELPAIYHEHKAPSDHKHDQMGPASYVGGSGHFHLTDLLTYDEIKELLALEI